MRPADPLPQPARRAARDSPGDRRDDDRPCLRPALRARGPAAGEQAAGGASGRAADAAGRERRPHAARAAARVRGGAAFPRRGARAASRGAWQPRHPAVRRAAAADRAARPLRAPRQPGQGPLAWSCRASSSRGSTPRGRARGRTAAISLDQVEPLRTRFCGAPAGAFKALVTHHPFMPPPDDTRPALVGRGAIALMAADELRRRPAAWPGTCTAATRATRAHTTSPCAARSSSPRRARPFRGARGPARPNSYNLVRIDPPRLEIETRVWQRDGFAPRHSVRFENARAAGTPFDLRPNVQSSADPAASRNPRSSPSVREWPWNRASAARPFTKSPFSGRKPRWQAPCYLQLARPPTTGREEPSVAVWRSPSEVETIEWREGTS